MWTGPGDSHRAAIGALIGLGLGVAMGIKVNTDNHAGAQIAAPLIFGGLGAMLGAVAGGSIMPLHSRNTHRPIGPEEDQVAKESSVVHTHESSAVRPAITPADGRPELMGTP
jgi:predicted permease